MPSSCKTPDLDWSQVRETVMMLDLSVTQIERAMRDGDDSITKLAELFTSLMGNIQIIGKAAKDLAESDAKAAIDSNFREISQKMNEAIVAFQFYDILLQRLTHAANSLGALSELIADPSRLFNPYEWYGLQEMIKSKYTLPQDRSMFEAILNGAGVDEALNQASKPVKPVAEEDNIELF